MGPNPTLLIMGGQAEHRERLRQAEHERRAGKAAAAAPRAGLGRTLRRALAGLAG